MIADPAADRDAGSERDAYLASMVEEDMRRTLFAAVDALGGVRGWIRDSRGMDVVGSPDLELAVPPVLYRLELKRPTRNPTPEQRRWLEVLAGCDRLISGIVRPLPTVDAYSLDDILAMLNGASSW